MNKAKKLAAAHRISDNANDDFKAAYDGGPLKNYLDPTQSKSGNEKRKIFRF